MRLRVLEIVTAVVWFLLAFALFALFARLPDLDDRYALPSTVVLETRG